MKYPDYFYSNYLPSVEVVFTDQEERVEHSQPAEEAGEGGVHLHLPAGEEEDGEDVAQEPQGGHHQDGHAVDVELQRGVQVTCHDGIFSNLAL